MTVWAGWSWILTAFGVVGLILAGRRKWQGWAIGLVTQVFWLWFAVASGQWGFIVSAIAYGIAYSINIWKWRKCETDDPRPGHRPSDHPRGSGRNHRAVAAGG